MTIRRRKKQFKIIILGIKQSEIKKNHVKGNEKRRKISNNSKERGRRMRDRDREKRMYMSRKQRDEKEEERDENDL